MAINVVVQSGSVNNLGLRYADDGKPELRWTLSQVEGGFTLWIPCCSYGTTGEKLAEQINDGDSIVITSGKLCWRKRTKAVMEERARRGVARGTCDGIRSASMRTDVKDLVTWAGTLHRLSGQCPLTYHPSTRDSRTLSHGGLGMRPRGSASSSSWCSPA
jgi:hypothetical protein